MPKYCLDRYKTQKLCDKAAADCLSTLKLVPDWFVTDHTTKTLHEALFNNDYILLLDEGPGNVTFSSDKMSILCVDLNNVKLGDANFDEDDPKTIIYVRRMAWHNEIKQSKALTMSVAWHPTIWWDWCVPGDKKKERDPTFSDEISIKLLVLLHSKQRC